MLVSRGQIKGTRMHFFATEGEEAWAFENLTFQCYAQLCLANIYSQRWGTPNYGRLASTLRLPLGTVKSRMHRMRRLLAQKRSLDASL